MSCSTDFKVGADYKEVTVVYGLLSVKDTAHYIKIMKGFFDEKQNNLSLAGNPDSIYFKNLNVTMEVLNNGSIIETIVLDKVDLINEGYVKEPGTFAESPNYAYKFKRNLDPARVYRLRVKNPETGKEVYAETPVITALPNAFRFVKPFDNLEQLFFTDPENPYVFIWRGPATAAFYDVVLQFRYQEVNAASPLDTTYVVKDIAIVKNLPGGNPGDISALLSSVDFFKQLNSAIPSAPFTIKRYVDTPGLKILAGGRELKTYIDVNTAQGGITFDQIKPNYTNFVGENVFGILSTRGFIEIQNIRFSASTLDSIISGDIVADRRFVGISSK
jgi:hypothetical protein